jgi:hypothetical protein
MSQSHQNCLLPSLKPIPAANKRHSLFVVMGLLFIVGATGIVAAATAPSVPFSESSSLEQSSATSIDRC